MEPSATAITFYHILRKQKQMSQSRLLTGTEDGGNGDSSSFSKHSLHCTLVVVNVVGVLTQRNTLWICNPLQHYVHLQCRRVRSLEFLAVAVLVAGSLRLGDITPPAAMIGYLSEPSERLSHTDTSPLVTQCAYSGT